jgi:phosphoglycerol transferase MdoB-like AlkP superfamily enzyme
VVRSLIAKLRGRVQPPRAAEADTAAPTAARACWWPPLAFAAIACTFAYAQALLAWSTYLHAKPWLIAWVPALFGPLFLETAVIGLIAIWLYGSSWRRVATWIVLLPAFAVNGAQLLSTMLASEYIAPAILRMASLIGMVASWQNIALLVVSTAAVSAIAAWGFQVSVWRAASMRQRVWASIIVLAWGAPLFALAKLGPAARLRAQYGLRPGAPVLSLALALRESMLDGETPEHALTPDELKLALTAGITIHPNAPAPFRKDWIYQRPLVFPKKGRHARPLNVIVFFFESWSTEVLGPYNPRWKAVTPHLADFAKEAMRVDDYVNHTIPTVTGLRGQLCSMFPSLAYTPWHDPEKPSVGEVLCLPKILEGEGYDSIYLNHGSAHATHFDSQTIDWGFGRSYFRPAVLGELLHGEPAKSENPKHETSDDQMMRATIELLKQRGTQKKPLFLAVSTIQTHTGVDLDHKFGDGKNQVLNTFNNLDEAFGKFWDWYRTSSWRDDTILIVTGDHVMYPHDALRRVASPRYMNERFGYLGLFIKDPSHALPASISVRASSVDFAPTVMQLLGLSSHRANSFMGLSLFGDRLQTPTALGFTYNKDVLIWDRARSRPQIAHSPKTGRARQFLDILRFEQQMERDHRLWFR